MSFTSLLFYFALAGAAGLFYLLPARWRSPYLLLISYGFYLTWSPAYLALLILATGISYMAGLGFLKPLSDRRRTALLWAGIVPIVGMLVFFKFEGHFSGLLLPLGISYYTFKLVSYLIESYWDESQVQRNLVDFALYPAFAPQIVSGPIQRPGDFFTQLIRVKSGNTDYARIEEGFRLVLGGLMLKLLVGDRLGSFIDIVDKSPGDYHWLILLTTIACYTLQLYADFAGYTNIAIGIGKIFDIDSPPNFNAPFASANIPEMWRRWHMSLTSWVTDYLFTPLNMALRNLRNLGLVLAIAINMVVIGLWHGITVNFLMFGICHAIFVITTIFTRQLRNSIFGQAVWSGKIRVVLGIILTFCLMTFSQLFWHTPTWESAMLHIKLLFGLTRTGHLGWSSIRTDVVEPVFICMALSFFIGAGAPGARWMRRGAYLVPNWMQYGFYLLLLSSLTIESGSKFIYGQF